MPQRGPRRSPIPLAHQRRNRRRWGRLCSLLSLFLFLLFFLFLLLGLLILPTATVCCRICRRRRRNNGSNCGCRGVGRDVRVRPRRDIKHLEHLLLRFTHQESGPNVEGEEADSLAIA